MQLKCSSYNCLIYICCLFCICSCKKLIQIDPPVNSITTTETFSDSADANSAILGIYSQLINSGSVAPISFVNGAISMYTGSSSDELIPYNSGDDQVYMNSVLSNNTVTYTSFWIPAYTYIYQANACIEGIQVSSGLSSEVKGQFTGEAKFIRALCYFYLVNLFGDVPYITSTAWAKTSLYTRTAKAEIYQHIIDDLTEAQTLLRSDFSISSGKRTRVNKWAATALLARAYLYTEAWGKAIDQASLLINNNQMFTLEDQLDKVFLTTSQEAILQWELNPTVYPYNATPEGINNIPYDTATPPLYYLSNTLLNAFEPDDKRRTAWVDSSNDGSTIYYYSFKYKVGVSKVAEGAPATEYYMVLRLAEQYLIRAEAEAQQNNLSDALKDLNIIRSRAGLNSLDMPMTQTEVLNAIAQERRIEFFAEWGHRWLDLKRTDQIDNVMSLATPDKAGGAWNSYQQLYPIPQAELQANPNLIQNPGY